MSRLTSSVCLATMTAALVTPVPSSAGATVTPSWAAVVTVATGDIDPDSVRIGGSTAAWRVLQGETWNVKASRLAPDRSWGDPVTLSAAGAPAEAPTTNDPGDFVVWRELEDGHWLIKSRHFDGAAWSPAQTLSTDGTDAAEPAIYSAESCDYECNWTEFVLFRELEAGSWLVKIVRLLGSEALTPAGTISTIGHDTRDLRVTDYGAIWSEFDGANWRARALPIYEGDWEVSDVQTVSPAGKDIDQPELTRHSIAVWRSLDGAHWRARVAEKSLSTGLWKTPVTVSVPGVDVEGVTATRGPRYESDFKALLVAWRQSDGVTWRVAAAERREGSWLASTFLTADTADASMPSVFSGFFEDGYYTRVHWTEHDGTSRRATAAVFLDAGEETTQHLSSPDVGVAAGSASGQDFAAWVEGEAPARAIKLRGFDVEPPASRMSWPLERTLQTSASTTVRWQGFDDWSLMSYDVRRRTIPWNSVTLPAPEPWLTHTQATAYPARLRLGTTHCFSSRARDATGKLGNWSYEVCAIRPTDEQVIPAGALWRRKNGDGYLAGSYLEATRRGAVLRMRGLTRVCRVALLVATGPRQGRIRLTFDTDWHYGDSSRILDLRAPTYQKQQIRRLVNFDPGTCRPGTLSVRVLSEGRPVRIDGVFIGKR